MDAEAAAEQPQAVAGLGLARSFKGEAAGLKDLDRAKQLDPSSGVPYLNTGIYFAQSKNSKDWKRAETELKTAIEKNVGNVDFPNSRAEQALADLQKRVKK